jgi:acetyl esterase/lipase
MQPTDVLTRSSRPPDGVLTYGELPDQIADLWLPAPTVAEPVLVVFLHGGFWRSAFDRRHVGTLAEALAADGFAVCAPEYRRVGQPGGGWPGTFEDVELAVTALPSAVGRATSGLVDGARMILAGHSAGGHLALWMAGRGTGPPVSTVISLAGVCDLAEGYRQGLGRSAVRELMGGGPEDQPERYRVADPMTLLPTGAQIALVHGLVDDRVPWTQSRDYGERATAAGDQVRCVLLPDIGHFELIDPLSSAWPAVLGEFRMAAAGLAEPP